ncbi:hypothetical protein INT43_006104 [Umbelopsis isabellina]|uniref:Galactose oxidase n=1 Tax=Mortierella isabellina TaxID=91625 RepID=A0A8H7UB41_MORIS|nr:hypothetical protein INT43_006104 [Umbelopsis isabellina]
MIDSWVSVILAFIGIVDAVYRQHHAATMLDASTVLLIGGADTPNNFSALLDLRHQQTRVENTTWPVAYHSAVTTMSNETLVLFGTTSLQRTNLSDALWSANTNTAISESPNVPTLRYGHTSLVTNQSIFVWGGMSSSQTVLGDVWQLSLVNMTWSPITSHAPGLVGHSSIIYNQWIVSCFGRNRHNKLHGKCHVIDSLTGSSHDFAYDSDSRPKARAWASLTLPNNSTTAILYGGHSKNGSLLNDLWTLDVSDLPTSLKWKHIPFDVSTGAIATARAGHIALPILPTANASSSYILIHGGEGPNTYTNDSTVQYLDINSLTWVSPSVIAQQLGGGIMMSDVTTNGSSIDFQQNGENETSTHHLSGGAIGGIVVGCLAIVAAAFGLFVWHRRRTNSKLSKVQSKQDIPPSTGVTLKPLQRTLSEKEDLPYITQPTPVKTHDRRSFVGQHLRDSLSIHNHSYMELIEQEEEEVGSEEPSHTVVKSMSATKPDYSTLDDSIVATPTSVKIDTIHENDEYPVHKQTQGRKQAPEPLVLTKAKALTTPTNSRISQLLTAETPQTSRLYLKRAPSARSTGRSVKSMQWVGYDPSVLTNSAQAPNLVVTNVRDSVISSEHTGSNISLPPHLPLRNSFGDEFNVTWPTGED